VQLRMLLSATLSKYMNKERKVVWFITKIPKKASQ